MNRSLVPQRRMASRGKKVASKSTPHEEIVESEPAYDHSNSLSSAQSLVTSMSEEDCSTTPTKSQALDCGPKLERLDEGQTEQLSLTTTCDDEDMNASDRDNVDIQECLLEDLYVIDSEDGIQEESATETCADDDALNSAVNETELEEVNNADDDMLEFMKSLGLNGAVGFLELSIAGSPPIHIVATETRAVRAQRKVVVHSVKPSHLGSELLTKIVNSPDCNHLRLECDRPLADIASWSGDLEIYFGTINAAAWASEHLHELGEGISIERDSGDADSKIPSTEPSKNLEDEMKPWTDLIVIVKNIGSTTETCKAQLAQLFPDADIIFHKDSSSDLLKGQAYLVFASKELANEAIKNFRYKQFQIDGRRLIIIRWNPAKMLPNGMLRIGERRLVMLTMLQIENKLSKDHSALLSAKYKALGEIVARDTKARHACGFPAPSYNQLKGLHDVRHYSDAEQALILRRLLLPYNLGGACEQGSGDRKRPLKSSDSLSSGAPPASNGTTVCQMNEGTSTANSTASVVNEKSVTVKSLHNEPTEKKVEKHHNIVAKKTTSEVKKGQFKLKNSSGYMKSKNRQKTGSAAKKPVSLFDLDVAPPPKIGAGLLGRYPLSHDHDTQQSRQPPVKALLREPYQLLRAPHTVSSLRSVDVMRKPSPTRTNKGSLLGSYPGEHTGHPLAYLDEPVSKMRRNDDDEICMPRYGDSVIKYPEDMLQQTDVSWSQRSRRERNEDVDNRGARSSRSLSECNSDMYVVTEKMKRDQHPGWEDPSCIHRDQHEQSRSAKKTRGIPSLFDNILEPPIGRSSQQHNEQQHFGLASHDVIIPVDSNQRDFKSHSRGESRMFGLDDVKPLMDDRYRGTSQFSETLFRHPYDQSTVNQPSPPKSPDPVSLLLNLSQLLADKLQRDKDKKLQRSKF